MDDSAVFISSLKEILIAASNMFHFLEEGEEKRELLCWLKSLFKIVDVTERNSNGNQELSEVNDDKYFYDKISNTAVNFRTNITFTSLPIQLTSSNLVDLSTQSVNILENEASSTEVKHERHTKAR